MQHFKILISIDCLRYFLEIIDVTLHQHNLAKYSEIIRMCCRRVEDNTCKLRQPHNRAGDLPPTIQHKGWEEVSRICWSGGLWVVGYVPRVLSFKAPPDHSPTQIPRTNHRDTTSLTCTHTHRQAYTLLPNRARR